MYTTTTVSSEHVWIYIHPKGKRMRNGTGITIYLLYKHNFAETIQKLYWQNKFGDIVEAPVLYIEEWNNIHTLLSFVIRPCISLFIMAKNNYFVTPQ